MEFRSSFVYLKFIVFSLFYLDNLNPCLGTLQIFYQRIVFMWTIIKNKYLHPLIFKIEFLSFFI